MLFVVRDDEGKGECCLFCQMKNDRMSVVCCVR